MVAQNIHMAELLAYVFPLAEVTLFLHTPTGDRLGDHAERRFPSVRVYFANNDVNLILYENAMKLCAGRSSTRSCSTTACVKPWSHNCCTALLMALCYVSLADEAARFTTLAERDDTGYQLLSMLHGCFSVSNSVTGRCSACTNASPCGSCTLRPSGEAQQRPSAACIEILRSYTTTWSQRHPQLRTSSQGNFTRTWRRTIQYAQEHAEQYVRAIENSGGAVEALLRALRPVTRSVFLSWRTT